MTLTMTPQAEHSRAASLGDTEEAASETTVLPAERLLDETGSRNPSRLEKGGRKDESDNTSEDNDDQTLWVDWEGPDDPENPKNWTYKQRWLITFIISSFTFISPVSSSMVAPASEQIAHQFGVQSTVLIAMTTSVFVLGYAFGPLLLGPLSEIYGRSRVLQCSNLFYLVWNLGCGFAQNKNQLIAFRFLAGLGGSAPLSIGGGVIGDVWRSEERGKAIAIYSLAPLLGPAIGPLCGSWIAERSTWRWVFWSTTIVDAFIQLSGLFFLRETYAPVLLSKKAQRIQKNLAAAGNELQRPIKTIYESSEKRSWKAFMWTSLTRPFQLFIHENIIQLLGLYMTFVYGVFYLFLTTMPAIFANIYHEDAGVGGLHYIALGIGLTVASQSNARYMDRVYIHFKRKNGGVGEPEFRLPTMFPGTILLPLGLLLTGWSAEHRIHWIATDIGIGIVGASVVIANQSIQTYVVDSFTLHAASGLAAVSFLRSLAGFGFPLFAPAMYAKLGYGKGDTILACVAIGLGCPAPVLLWKYGKRIRMNSKYAHQGQAQNGTENATQTDVEKHGREEDQSDIDDLSNTQGSVIGGNTGNDAKA